MFYRNGERVDEVVGANQPEIQRLCRKWLHASPEDAPALPAIAPPAPTEEEDDAQE